MANCKSVITLFEDSFTVCGDAGLNISNMMSTPISEIDSLKEFKDTMVSELIDAKHFKTQSSYPTLRLVYERYMNSTAYCDTLSSQFDYCDMLQFSELVGTYWVDLIEQVVPATTIWGSTYVYGNTLWDQQKFTYKKYSLFTCDLPNFGGDVVSPTTGWTNDVQVEWETLQNDSFYDEVSGSTTGDTFSDVDFQPIVSSKMRQVKVDPVKDNSCIGVGILQTNCGSEFVGRIVDTRKQGTDTRDTVVTECAISIEIQDYHIVDGNVQLWPEVSGDVTGPISFSWSDGQTTQNATSLSGGETYTVTVYDDGIEGCSATASFTIPVLEQSLVFEACWYPLPENAQHMLNITTEPMIGSETVVQNFAVTGITINGIETIGSYNESFTATSAATDFNWVTANNTVTGNGVTGQTYTNFVDFLNNAFISMGVEGEFSAQIATGITEYDAFGGEITGFYIIRPVGTTFNLYMGNTGGSAYDYEYDETGLSLIGGSFNALYDYVNCDGIVMDGSTVIDVPTNSACWYSLPEEPQGLLNVTTSPYLDVSPTSHTQTFAITGITVNGVETIASYEESFSATSATTEYNWIPANNDVVGGGVTGQTYTNFVDFLNNAFVALGVENEFSAQIATGLTSTNLYGETRSGFYIISPYDSTFTLAMDNTGGSAYDYTYTESGIGAFLWDSAFDSATNPLYDLSICTGIQVKDGIVTND